MVKGCATDIYWERKGTLGGKKLICGSKTCSRTQMEYATFRQQLISELVHEAGTKV
jgi:hypothetical protein